LSYIFALYFQNYSKLSNNTKFVTFCLMFIANFFSSSLSCRNWSPNYPVLVILSTTPSQWGLISCRFCLALCRPLQLELLSAKARAPSNTAKTAEFFFLFYVYNQFLCSLTCTNTQFFSRTLDYLIVLTTFFISFVLKKDAARLQVGSKLCLGCPTALFQRPF
jgi:hypothetical protein